MADITDQEVIRFTNEYVRPMCERLRAMTMRGVVFSDSWAAISDKVPNDSSVLADDRESQGVSRLTGAEINTITSAFLALLTAVQQSPARATINKACVRPVEIAD